VVAAELATGHRAKRFEEDTFLFGPGARDEAGGRRASTRADLHGA
jgi:hypothetical protein